MFDPPPQFLDLVRELAIELEPGDVDRLGRYLVLLLERNRQFNLTSITDPDEAWTRHIGDSLTLLPLIASLEAKTAIDVGSGGGLPGIPLSITMPDVHFTLLESTGKKARFIEEAAATLGASNIGVINDRAETSGRDPKHREKYDVVLARAVGRLPVLLELTVPFAKTRGHVLAIKGEQAAVEIAESKQALHALHAHVIDTQRTSTGTIVIIEKQRATPHKYPRPPGEPKRRPL